eukprot:6663562-Pyramimonas_sp.AAC.1
MPLCCVRWNCLPLPICRLSAFQILRRGPRETTRAPSALCTNLAPTVSMWARAPWYGTQVGTLVELGASVSTYGASAASPAGPQLRGAVGASCWPLGAPRGS